MIENISIDVYVENKELLIHDYSLNEISTLNNGELQYDYFYKNYMLKNLPCVVKNISSSWQCNDQWVKNDMINYDCLIDKYGDIDAPIADCDKIYFNAQCKNDMKVKDYMTYLRSEKKEKLLYLKDWHLKKLLPNDNFYEVPKIFASDWLNEYASDLKDDDFMFVYIGSKNTWTPFHADVYTSYSWSVNVVGRKKWILLPPGEEEKIKDALGNLPLLFEPKNYENVKYFEIIQEKGDGIFVPSGWHHQVFNLLDTISINHNFINACNIEFVWNSLKNNLNSVENEIKEFTHTPEFTSQCQLILKSVFGMDFEAFIKLIIHISQKRLNYIKGNNFLLFNKYYFKENHVHFDLYQINNLINLIQNHPLYKNNSLSHDLLIKLLDIQSALYQNCNFLQL